MNQTNIDLLSKKNISHLIYAILLGCLISCGSTKKAETYLNTGNFDKTIEIAINKLKYKKQKKSNQKYIIVLEDAYKKANQKDLADINFMKKENNKENLKRIYHKYVMLDKRQQNVGALLPLYINEENRQAIFQTANYADEIIHYKRLLSDYLYEKTLPLLESQNKYDFREAYRNLDYIQYINPGYKDVRNLKAIAHINGIDYVYLQLKNDTDQVIPKKLEEDVLNISTYGLNDIWTEYHNKKLPEIKYDYNVMLIFKDIKISPEQITEKQVIKEKEIRVKDVYKLDRNGNKVKDANGDYVKLAVKKNIRCELYQFTQFKSSVISGEVKVFENYSQQQIESIPISSNFVFEHIYANFKGDKRALSDDLLALTSIVRTEFPSNEQMIYDTGEDLKNKMKHILSRIQYNK